MNPVQLSFVALSAFLLNFYGLRLLKVSLFLAGSLSAWGLAAELLKGFPEMSVYLAAGISILLALLVGFLCVAMVKLAAFILGVSLAVLLLPYARPMLVNLDQNYAIIVLVLFVVFSGVVILLLRERLIILLTCLIASLVFSNCLLDVLGSSSQYLTDNVMLLKSITILSSTFFFFWGFKTQNCKKSD